MKSELIRPSHKLSWRQAGWGMVVYLISAIVGLFLLAEWANSQLTGPFDTVVKSSQGVLTDVSGFATNLEVSQTTGAPQSGTWSVTGFYIDLRYSTHFLDLSRVTYYGCSAAANICGVSLFVVNDSYVTEFVTEHSLYTRQNSGSTLASYMYPFYESGATYPVEGDATGSKFFSVANNARRGYWHKFFTGLEGPTSGESIFIVERSVVY